MNRALSYLKNIMGVGSLGPKRETGMNALDLCQDLVGRQCEPHCVDEKTEGSSNELRVTQLTLEGSRARTQT